MDFKNTIYVQTFNRSKEKEQTCIKCDSAMEVDMESSCSKAIVHKCPTCNLVMQSEPEVTGIEVGWMPLNELLNR